MPLTDRQRDALAALRAMNSGAPSSIDGPESVEERARRPAPETLPLDVAVCIEIAPHSPHQDPLLESTGVLKTPERVPVYIYSLNNDHDQASTIADPGPVGEKHVIFFIHGGGNLVGHPTTPSFIAYYAQLLRTAALHSGNATECVLVAPSYRLAVAPKNTFPAGVQDNLAAYDYILSKGYNPSNIVIAGDSAGGNHAVVLTHLILQSGRPCPHGVVAIAPLAIQTIDLLSDYAKSLVGKDILDLPMLDYMCRAYIGTSGLTPTNPLVSGCFIPFTITWPKTLIIVGTADMLVDASRELEKRLVAVGRPVELVEYDERPHGWWTMPDIFAENIRDSAERIARFVLH